MVWRGSNTLQDRIFSSLVYVIPVLELFIHGFAGPLFKMLPFLNILFFPFLYILPFYAFSYRGYPIVSFAIFLGLLLGVVGNSNKFRHFLRFHTMQALMLSLFVFLSGAIIDLFGFTRSMVGIPNSFVEGLFWQSIATLIFVVVFGAVIYAVVQAVKGLYAEMPAISDAAYRFCGMR